MVALPRPVHPVGIVGNDFIAGKGVGPMKPEPETKSARMRQLEERRARDFNTFLASLEGKAAEQDNYRNGEDN